MKLLSTFSSLFGLLFRIFLPLGILGAGAFAFAMLSVEPLEETSPAPSIEAIRTRVMELEAQDYQVVVETNGIVMPHNEVTLSALVSGQVLRVSPAFEVGAYFNVGDVLLELDPRDYETALAVAKAQRLGASAALQLARQSHERTLRLVLTNNISDAEVNQTAATLAQAEAELESLIAQVEQAERDLERTRIIAPFDGRVRAKMVGPGQSLNTGEPLGVVFAVDFAEVRLPIANRELAYLELPELSDDPPVKVTLRDALDESSETVWQVTIVRTEGALDENSLELFAIARIDDPFGLQSEAPPLRIGQPVQASIAGKLLNDVVALPRVAVRQLDQINLVEKDGLRLLPKTITPIWSDKDSVIVEAALIPPDTLLATTHIVYGAKGAKVEIIPALDQTTTNTPVIPISNDTTTSRN